MASTSRSTVQFSGIDEETEDKKTIRRAEKQARKRREREEKRKESLELREEVRPFLVYLAQTRTDDELISEVREREVAMFIVRELFPDIEKDDDNAPVDESDEAKKARVERAQLEAFCRVVRCLRLPKARKKQQEHKVRMLHRMMRYYHQCGLYDEELDRFLQDIGGLGSDKTPGDLLAELAGRGRNQEQYRQIGNEVERLGAGNFPASRLSLEHQALLRAL